MWRRIASTAEVLWSVGQRLRRVYNGSKNEEVRRRDQAQTALRVGLFLVSCVAFIWIDGYEDAFAALRALLQTLRAEGTPPLEASITTTP